MFQDYNMNPQDMNFKVVQMQTETFDKMLEMVASFSPDNVIVKEMKLIVIETNTNTHVGYIKLGSPLINSKPRNDYLGGVPDLPVFNNVLSWVLILCLFNHSVIIILVVNSLLQFVIHMQFVEC